MRYVIQAAHITEVYDVAKNKNSEGEYIKKPEFVPSNKYDWEDILSFECNELESNLSTKNTLGFLSNDGSPCLMHINISESEEVGIKEKVFRADLATTYLRSDKVLSRKEDTLTNKEAYLKELEKYRDFVFEEYPAVKEHCDIYHPENILENIDKIKDKVISNEVLKHDEPYWFSNSRLTPLIPANKSKIIKSVYEPLKVPYK